VPSQRPFDPNASEVMMIKLLIYLSNWRGTERYRKCSTLINGFGLTIFMVLADIFCEDPLFDLR